MRLLRCDTGRPFQFFFGLFICCRLVKVAFGKGCLVDSTDRIVQDAYVYLYPLVLMDITRKVSTNVEPGSKPGFGPENAFFHMSQFPSTEFREVVRPNFDTLYSFAWLDLSEGPMVISVPNTAGRFYLLQMMDMWTDVFAVPGSRTTGNEAADFLVVPHGWDGTEPTDLTRIVAPTPGVWIIGRTQTNGPADYENVYRVQEGFRITPASVWPELSPAPELAPDVKVDMETPPVVQANSMNGIDFFKYAFDLLQVHSPHINDQPIASVMSRIGLQVGDALDIDALAPDVRDALEQAPGPAIAAMQAALPKLYPVVNGWIMPRANIGAYGTNYLARAVVALVGLGANLPEDAVYPTLLHDSEGEQPNGTNTYTLHFEGSKVPPVDAFWSVSLYDDEGFAAPNELQRHALGDRDSLSFNDDGSLDLMIGHDKPAKEDANWLPAPTGPFGLILRLYSPHPEIVDGSWEPPPLTRF